MKERPILFSGPMVRAILADRKTQTRRVVTPPQPSVVDYPARYLPNEWGFWHDEYYPNGRVVICPYGVPGDRLWVRETWATSGLRKYDYTGDPDDHGGPNDRCCAYAATATYKCGRGIPGEALARGAHRWKSPIFMPRWASRITLEVTAVRVERLQEISEEDARAEGFSSDGRPGTVNGEPATVYAFEPRVWFAQGWDALNAKRGYGWASNPWVWVISFQRAPEGMPTEDQR